MKTLLMKKTLFSFLIALVLASSACSRPFQFRKDDPYGKREESDPSALAADRKIASIGQLKKQMLVLSFWNDTLVKSDELGNFAAEELRKGLYETEQVIPPPDGVSTTQRTDDFVRGNEIKVEQLYREGQKLGVPLLVIGRIVRIQFRQAGEDFGIFGQKKSFAEAELEIKLYDIQGGREVAASNQIGVSEQSSYSVFTENPNPFESSSYRMELAQGAIREAAARFVPEILKAAEKTVWQGRILQIIGNKFYVNAGRATGLIRRDILRVVSPAEEIYDSKNGVFLAKTLGRLKGTLEVVDFLENDVGVAQLHTGGGFQVGDSVQLY